MSGEFGCDIIACRIDAVAADASAAEFRGSEKFCVVCEIVAGALWRNPSRGFQRPAGERRCDRAAERQSDEQQTQAGSPARVYVHGWVTLACLRNAIEGRGARHL